MTAFPRACYVTAADLSPDGETVAFTTLTAAPDGDVHEAWRAPGERVELPGTPQAVRWSPDGGTLAVTVAGDDGTAQIWLAPDRGQVRQLTTLPRGVTGSVAWSADGRHLAVGARRDTATDLAEPHRIDRVPWLMDAAGRVADLVADLALVDAATGRADRLTGGPTIDRDPVFGDGRILFATSHDPATLTPRDRLALVGDAGEVTELPWPGGTSAAGAFAGGGRLALLAARPTDRRRGEAPDVFVLHPDGTLENRTAGCDLFFNGTLLGDLPTSIGDAGRFLAVHGDAALAPVLRGGTMEVARVALSGTPQVTTVAAGHPLALRGSRLLCAVGSMHAPPELVVTDLESGGATRVTDLNAAILPAPLAVERLDVTSPDGTAVEAWFLRPPGRPAPHPTVLVIHGGPYCAFGEILHLDAQALARAGYGVILANPRGSIGYGTAFGTATRGAWGARDYEDLLASVDAAVAAGLADPERLGVNGLSYGGYMTAWIVSHTDRFRAAVAENPVVDLISFRGTSDIGIGFTDDVMDGSPRDVRDRYVRCSPLTHAHRCTTPTRVVVSEADHRCPPSQGEQLFSALREAGCEADMVRLPGAGHGGSIVGRRAVRDAQDEALLEWMRRHLGPPA